MCKCVLIPSSSGLHFKQAKIAEANVKVSSLNPFFVRSSFQTCRRTGDFAPPSGLNPFFVRSSFQTEAKIARIGLALEVLIPSSSGLHFKHLRQILMRDLTKS